jgi:hypothetical protein
MSSRTLKGTVTSFAVVAASLIGCGAAPESLSESTEMASEAQCKNPPCIITPPPPTQVCKWNALTTYPQRGTTPDWQTENEPISHCVSATATDVISEAQRYFMTQGCSNPIYWYTFDPAHPSENFANAEMQLCPLSYDITAYMNTYLRTPYAYANDPMTLDPSKAQPVDPYSGGTQRNALAHTNFSYSDRMIPPPPSLDPNFTGGAYFWVISWMDPMCMGPCMFNAPEDGPLPTLQVPQ